MKKTSYILGEAEVVFGGSIAVPSYYDPNTKTGAISFNELKEQKGVGEDIKDDDEMLEPQVWLIFNNVESINVVRRALNRVEYALKNGEFQQKVEGEK